MAVIATPDGFMSIRESDIKPTDIVISRRDRTATSPTPPPTQLPMSTIDTPTPTATVGQTEESVKQATQEILRRRTIREEEVTRRTRASLGFLAPIAQFSGERIVEPTLKFLRGDLPFQKKIEPRPLPKPIPEKKPQQETGTFIDKIKIRKTIDDSFWGLTDKVEKLLLKLGVKKDTGVLTTTLDTRNFRDVPSEILLWGFFAPAMSSGAAGTKTIQRIKKKNPLAKNRFDALGEQLNRLEVEVASKATLEEQSAVLRRIRNQLKTEEEIRGFDTWVKSLRDKQILKEPKVTVKTEAGQTIIEIPSGVPKPERVGVVDIDVPTIREVKFLSPAPALQVDDSLSSNIFNQQALREKQLFFTKTKQRSIQKLQEEQRQRELQKLGLTQTQIQKQIQKERLKEAQITGQATSLLTLQTGSLGFKVPQKLRVPRRLKEPVKIKIPRIPRGVSKTKLVTELAKISKKKKGVDVVVGMKIGKQRTIGKNLPPFKALKLGRDFVDKNIEASFRLKRTGKTTRKKDIKPFNVGKKFRPSKRNPLFVVEKRKFRLDSPSEKKQIKLARRLKLV